MASNFIQKLRKSLDMTQEQVAGKLGISRPTYLQIERGERDMTIPEARILADMFDVTLEDFLNEKTVNYNVSLPHEKKASPKENTFRISIPQKNLEKFREILLYILTKVGGKPNVGETVLYKLLYFIDFDYYEKFEEQLIGATYIKNHYGPTPVEFKAIVEKMIKEGELVKVQEKYFNHEQKKYLPVREPDLTKLKNARELQHIDEVLARLSDKNATELSEYSHEDIPWIIADTNMQLDYEAVFYRTPKTSVRNYDQQSKI